MPIRIAENLRIRLERAMNRVRMVEVYFFDLTLRMIIWDASSISSFFVQRPKLRRRAPKACSLVIPMARRTAEGSVDPAWQAEPVDAAISGICRSNSSPPTPSMLMLSVLGKRFSGCPLSFTFSSPKPSRMFLCNLSLNFLTLWLKLVRLLEAISHACPSPMM